MFFSLPLAAQENGDQPPPSRLVFLELFTAEICPFCPQAERNFNDIIQSEDIIGYSCLVDYFESGTHNPYAQPFCRTRQDYYRARIKGGSRYTPQLILNGRTEMPGQNFQNIADAIRLGREAGHVVRALEVRPGKDSGTFDIVLPAIAAESGDDLEKQPFSLNVILVQRRPAPNSLPLGRIRRDQPPFHLAVGMEEAGLWDGIPMIWTVRPPASAVNDVAGDRLIAIVQNRITGVIVAAGDVNLDGGP
jgi:hypothetical protein